MDRREFLKKSGAALAGTLALGSQTALASGHEKELPPNTLGVLVDTTLCVGCRKCELACDRVNNLTGKPEKFFEEQSVFDKRRFLNPDSFTIVNKFENPKNASNPIFVKTQCMHCNHPACVSACIVGALKKAPNGAVTYDFGKCIGCRYCMMACPFTVPTNQFDNALTPSIRKCTFCQPRISKGGTPACAEACPMGVMTFGKRTDLIEAAKERILRNPGRYIDHVYGEFDSGGTSWMYLAGAPFEYLRFPKYDEKAPAALSETIMHSAFKKWLPPLSLYAIIGASMWLFNPRDKSEGDH